MGIVRRYSTGKIAITGAALALYGVSAASGLTPPNLELPEDASEIGQQVQDLVQVTDSPMIVWNAPVDADDETAYSKNRLPNAGDAVVVHSSGDLNVPDGVTLTVDFLRVDGEVDVADGGAIEFDTIYVMPGGVLNCYNGTLRCRNDSDISVVRDPDLVSRGIVVVDGGTLNVRGDPKQRLLPLTDASLTTSDDTIELGHPIFITNETPPPLVEDYTFDWAIGDRLVITATEPRGDGAGSWWGLTNEIGEIQSITTNVNSTAFAVNDPDGTSVTLTQTLDWPHKEYDDATVRAKFRAVGPPSGSHPNWVMRTHIMNMTRSCKFTVTDETAQWNNVHRCPYVLMNSSDCLIEWCEFIAWNRQDGTADSIKPGDMKPYSANTNLRYRTAVVGYKGRDSDPEWGAEIADATALTALQEADLVDGEFRRVVGERKNYRYDAAALNGDYAPDDQSGGTGFWVYAPVRTVRGCSFGGYTSVGSPFHNDEEAHGSRGGFWSQYHCRGQIEQNNFFNSALAGITLQSSHETGEFLMNAIAGITGDTPTAHSGTGSKDFDTYTSGDGGRDGAGIFSFSREPLFTRNLCYGCNGPGFNIIGRHNDGIDFPTRHSRMPHYFYNWRQDVGSDTKHHAPVFVEGPYVIACDQGNFITKPNGRQEHQIPAKVTNGLFISNWIGFSLEYVGNYAVINVMVAAPVNVFDAKRSPGTTGFSIGQKTAAIVLTNCYAANWTNGMHFSKSWEASGQETPSPDLELHSVNFTTDGVTTKYLNLEAYEIHEGVTITGQFGLTLDSYPKYTDGTAQSSGVRFTGTLHTDIGDLPFPLGANLLAPEYVRARLQDINGRLVTPEFINGIENNGGRWFDSTLDGGAGNDFILYPVTFYDPLTGVFRVSFDPLETDRDEQGGAEIFLWRDGEGTLLPANDNGAGSYSDFVTAAEAIRATA